MKKQGKMAKVAVGICCTILAFSTQIMLGCTQTTAPQEGEMVNDVTVIKSTDLLKLISSRSFKASNIKRIVLDYNSNPDNIIIQASTDNNIKLKEYNSVKNKVYAANSILKNGILTISQSASVPSGGYDSEAKIFIPADYSGKVIVKSKGNIKISGTNGTATYNITNDTGVVSFFSLTAKKIKVNAPNSSIVTMRDVKAFVDLSVIGYITINGDTVIGGKINGTKGTLSSTITVNIAALNGNLNIQNKYGTVFVGFPALAAFKIDVTAQSVSNTYPGYFQSSYDFIKGKSGKNPKYTLTSKAGSFILSEIS